MAVSPFDSIIQGGLFSDPEIAPLFADEMVVDAMVRVEVALANVQAAMGLIPKEAAAKIEKAAAVFQPDYPEIAASTEESGVPIIALVKQLRKAAGDGGPYVHWGATSQDIIDTGLILRLKETLVVIDRRLELVSGRLADLADTHRQTVMLGRTRSQQAIPTTFGLKAAGWLDGLMSAADNLKDLRPRLLRVQFGGAVGTLAALGGQGPAVADKLAGALELLPAIAPWHTNRTSLVAFADALSLVTGCLGKIGQDMVMLSQTEVAEVQQSGGGGSSTMPQKSNPVRAETLVALARMNAGLVGNMHQAQLQEHERGGPGWQLEELTLPQMVVSCGAALRQMEKLLTGLNVNSDRMARNLAAANGLVLAEAATFALAAHMDRSSAQALVKTAVGDVLNTGQNLMDILKTKTDAPVDWPALAAPANYVGSSEAIISRVLKRYNESFQNLKG